MFTGLVTDLGRITQVAPHAKGIALEVDALNPAFPMSLGASIAVNGVCLTVTSFTQGRFTADISSETLRCTTAGNWQEGQRVNLEASLKMGDAMGGHLVLGHVDAVAEITGQTLEGDCVHWEFRAPEDMMRFIAPKGSVTIDGISLTVNQLQGAHFTVTTIPHTLSHTNLQFAKLGDRVNIEIDVIARYVARQMGNV